MPAIQTHYAFAKFNAINNERKHFGALLLGSQGPDPFFFVGQLPWIKRKYPRFANDFGVGLHHKDWSELYASMIDYASKSDRKELLLDYIEGLLMHYALDRNCHPYVFSVTGFDLPEDDIKKKKYYSSYHTRIESAIDMIYAGRNGVYSKDPKFNLNCVGKDELIEISNMWFEANKATFKHERIEPDSFYLGVKDYASVLKFLNHRRWFKRWFVGTFIGEMSSGYALIYPESLKKRYGDVDFMNDKKKEWPDPVSGEMRSESFMELIEKAKEEYIEIIVPLMEKAKRGENVLNDMHLFYDDIDHDGVKEGKEKRHMKPLFPYKE